MLRLQNTDQYTLNKSVEVKIWVRVTFREPFYLRIRTKAVLESDKKGKITTGSRTIIKHQQREWMSTIFT